MYVAARRSSADTGADTFTRATATTGAITTITDTARASASASASAPIRRITVQLTDIRITTRITTIRMTIRPGTTLGRWWFPGLWLLPESFQAATGGASADSPATGFGKRGAVCDILPQAGAHGAAFFYKSVIFQRGSRYILTGKCTERTSNRMKRFW